MIEHYVTLRWMLEQQILQWLPSVDPQQINMVSTSRDDCTAGCIVIMSYDMMTRCHDQLTEAKHRVIIAVNALSSLLIIVIIITDIVFWLSGDIQSLSLSLSVSLSLTVLAAIFQVNLG